MHIEKSKILKLFIITPNTIFKDHRGEYIESYNKEIYLNSGIGVDFVQDDFSISAKGVLRGIHGDDKTWKLVSCIHGSFFLVVINNNKDSEDYRKCESFILSEKNKKQVLIPPFYGNGHQVVTKKAIFHYKQSTFYNRKSQFTIKWNDPIFNIQWPIKRPILSKRDT